MIYSFEVLASSRNAISILTSLKTVIWNVTGGILQADGERFSNENGFHILWQFDDDAEGEWHMAIRTFLGRWKNFKMDLGNPDHREAFKNGKVPKTAVLV